MSDVTRYFTTGTLLSCQATRKLYSHATDYVRASDYDAAQSQLAALREELATAKRNEHNSEVAYKSAIERQEELRESLVDKREEYNKLGDRHDALEQRLADAERRNALVESLLRESLEEDDGTSDWFDRVIAALRDKPVDAAPLSPDHSGGAGKVVLPTAGDMHYLITKAARDADRMSGANYYTAAEFAAGALLDKVKELNQ